MRKWLAEHPEAIAGILLFLVLAVIAAFFCFVVATPPKDFKAFLICLFVEIVVAGIFIWMFNG